MRTNSLIKEESFPESLSGGEYLFFTGKMEGRNDEFYSQVFTKYY
jgi:hypothetical protein